jgi:hypothetical protein
MEKISKLANKAEAEKSENQRIYGLRDLCTKSWILRKINDK